MALVAYGSSSDSDSDADDATVGEVDIKTQLSSDQVSVRSNGKPVENTTNVPSVEDDGPDPTEFTISDEEDDDCRVSVGGSARPGTGLHLPPPKSNDVSATGMTTDNKETTPSVSILCGLPAPKHEGGAVLGQVQEEELEDIVKPKAYETTSDVPQPPKRARTTVKITIPSLPKDDSDDEDSMKRKKPKASAGKSGLFSVLPAPKHVSGRALVPHTLTKRPQPPKPPRKPPVKQSNPAPLPVVLTADKVDDAEEEEEEDGNKGDDSEGNFFSLGAADNKSTPGIDMPTSSGFSVSVNSSISASRPVLGQKESSVIHQNDGEMDTDITEDSTLPAAEQGSVQVAQPAAGADMADEPLQFAKTHQAMNSGAWGARPMDTHQAWQGAQVYEEETPDEDEPTLEPIDVQSLSQDEQFLRMRGKNRSGKEEINIIDVRADDQLSAVELTKMLSEEGPVASHSKKKNQDNFTSQQKRKHQITYLAHKAKEREFDLKNQWAENRLTRQQTQNKYGF